MIKIWKTFAIPQSETKESEEQKKVKEHAHSIHEYPLKKTLLKQK